jgi:hypothetical protein
MAADKIVLLSLPFLPANLDFACVSTVQRNLGATRRGLRGKLRGRAMAPGLAFLGPLLFERNTFYFVTTTRNSVVRLQKN